MQVPSFSCGLARRVRRSFSALGLFFALAYCNAQGADEWPSKPIRIVVPVAAGSATDLVAREMAPRISKQLGQSVLVDNRPGADMGIGITAVNKSLADGYTWLLVSSTLTSSAVLKKVPFDPVKDFAPVLVLGSAATVAVVPAALGVRNLKEFVALAKSKSNAINYANPSNGSLGHLHSVLLEHAAGITLTGVPYKGSSVALTDLLANRVQFMMAPPGVVLPYVKAGTLIALATGGLERSPLYPGLPTLAEQGVAGVELEAWMGILMPAKTPQAIIDRASVAIKTALSEPGAHEAIERAGVRVVTRGTSATFAHRIKDEMTMWPKLFELANVHIED